jgi:hypothetical protein
MAIYLRNPENLRPWGHAASLYASTKQEIIAAGSTVTTVNEGTIVVIPGSDCITKLGEVLLLDPVDGWGEI